MRVGIQVILSGWLEGGRWRPADAGVVPRESGVDGGSRRFSIDNNIKLKSDL